MAKTLGFFLYWLIFEKVFQVFSWPEPIREKHNFNKAGYSGYETLKQLAICSITIGF